MNNANLLTGRSLVVLWQGRGPGQLDSQLSLEIRVPVPSPGPDLDL